LGLDAIVSISGKTIPLEHVEAGKSILSEATLSGIRNLALGQILRVVAECTGICHTCLIVG
jgi:ferredoxin